MDKAFYLQFGKVFLNSFIRDAYGLGQFAGGVFGVSLEEFNDFLPTFLCKNIIFSLLFKMIIENLRIEKNWENLS